MNALVIPLIGGIPIPMRHCNATHSFCYNMIGVQPSHMASINSKDTQHDGADTGQLPSELAKLSTRFCAGFFDTILVSIALGMVFWSLSTRMWMYGFANPTNDSKRR